LTLFIAGFYVLMLVGQGGDAIARIAIWGILIAMSVRVVIRMLRGGSVAPYGQDVALGRRWRRWIFDEPDSKDKH
jgi:hypothetical protein